ncbi:hypothetical protein ACWDUD_04510 [Rhodococcus sp. NPDC003382]|uniref:hypothetical protein n=1 Tax=unclassified Rhodococcus (in: high G+C Gram-positive bacteria) TaxID=192944 RepID=UPI0018CDD99D|nr:MULTISPECIES: hypothetical protein [unclassified Rhodococcus (in: high G+C Gram-positive bacteria)]MBH0122657.1 hypothetical protein [Rhodococcus sp. CX]MCK8672531.1 hypothetical protein [Rhodococcus sp. HM1]
MGRPAVRATAVVVGLAVALVAGCSSDTDAEKVPTREPATPMAAPETTTPPAGTVQQVGTGVEALAQAPGTDVLAALVDDGTRLLLTGSATDSEPRPVQLPRDAVTVLPGPDGQVLAPAAGAVLRVDVDSGEVAEVPVDGDATAVAVLPDGRWAVGTATGTTYVLDPASGAVESTITGLVSVDVLVAAGDDVAALDRRQTSITELNLSDERLRMALRAGEGAAQMISDPYGRVVVTDTQDDELLVYTLDTLVLRQRYPSGPGLYGVAYDEARDLVWVTLTGSNEVVGYDLSTGIPREKQRFATVRQPDSVSVDSDDAVLVIGSATGDGLQRIPIGGE